MSQEKNVETIEQQEQKRYYTHCIVSYANKDEL